jgi:hypothetical protein
MMTVAERPPRNFAAHEKTSVSVTMPTSGAVKGWKKPANTARFRPGEMPLDKPNVRGHGAEAEGGREGRLGHLPRV